MEHEWQHYERKPVEQNDNRIYVTINNRRNIYLNRRALEALGDPESVLLMYDNRRSTIGIQRAPASSRNAFRVKTKDSRNGGRGGRVIHAAAFCRHFHITPSETLVFHSARVDSQGVLILSFHDVISARK